MLIWLFPDSLSHDLLFFIIYATKEHSNLSIRCYWWLIFLCNMIHFAAISFSVLSHFVFPWSLNKLKT